MAKNFKDETEFYSVKKQKLGKITNNQYVKNSRIWNLTSIHANYVIIVNKLL
jgi:hypothetical protein